MTYIPGPVTVEDELELARRVRALEVLVRLRRWEHARRKRVLREELREEARRRRLNVFSYADF